MSTETKTGGSGMLWKILGIVVVLVVLSVIIVPLLRGLFWLAFVALAVYGGFMLWRAMSKSDGTNPPAQY